MTSAQIGNTDKLSQVETIASENVTAEGAGRPNPSMSKRGSKALAPFSPYIKAVNEAKTSPWSPENDGGYFLVSRRLLSVTDQLASPIRADRF